MSVAHVARGLVVCLAATSLARAEVPAEAPRPAPEAPAPSKSRSPPPMVLIVPLVGPVLLPVTLPTSVPHRRRATPSREGASTARGDSSAAATSVP